MSTRQAPAGPATGWPGLAAGTEPAASQTHERVYGKLAQALDAVGTTAFLARSRAASQDFARTGPVLRGRPLAADWVPRIVPHEEWEIVEAGIRQRFRALCAFAEAYLSGHDDSVAALPAPPARAQPARLHLYAPDLLRAPDGRLNVIEDNLGHPAAQVFATLVREQQLRAFPELFDCVDVRDLPEFGSELGAVCRAAAGEADGEIVYLWPGPARTSEAFEVERVVRSGGLALATPDEVRLGHDGWLQLRDPPRRVAALHVRLPPDDPGNDLVDAVAAAGRTIVLSPHRDRVPGDKAVHPWVPDLIRRYLGEEPILAQPESHWLGRPEARGEILADPRGWVLKERVGVGGHGVRFGDEVLDQGDLAWLDAVRADPARFVAQQVVVPSTHLSVTEEPALAVRGIDLRFYALADGEEVRVLPLGLTRRLGEATARSNLANAGTAIKDTWVGVSP